MAGADVKVSSQTATRMLQALSAAGWGCHQIAAEIGGHGHHISELRAGNQDLVKQSTASRITAFFRAREGSPNTGHGAKRARAWAMKQRWHTAHCWDDIVTDRHPKCRDQCFGVRDIDEKIRALNAKGMPDTKIAQALDRTCSNITFRRRAMGIPAVRKATA
ncbi:hypothetical protein MUN77_01490 [Leucobacter allii]|uniref:hypothetical protein n=1 Tax=Leucobacter allii TaxID=2932247 RepID=UPI001FD246DC|nr:hypothetical protein [Leucobacter allii]UOR02032.1 hypothetical protein MUN77_01490 [Leucobacter allii]